MAVLNPRSRMISVRLSEEEYLALRHLCSVTGARSVSDLTRDAMQALVNGTNREDVLDRYMDEFRAQINKLDRKVEELVKRAESARNEQES